MCLSCTEHLNSLHRNHRLLIEETREEEDDMEDLLHRELKQLNIKRKAILSDCFFNE